MTKEKRYILVTGGYGFIGSNFIRDWYNKYPNYFLVNLDILTYAGNPDNLKDIEEIEGKKEHADRRYEFFRGDVCDPIIVGSIFEKYPISGIIHFAAETHVDRSYHNASDFVRTNIEGTRHMMDMVKKYNVSKMVHVSTDEVYGDVPEGAVKEDYAFSPSNPYAASKAGADLLVQSYVKVYKLPINIVRGSNNYGPYQYPEKLIPVTISHLLEGKQIPVHGDGKHVRQWIHTHDFGTGIDIVFHAPTVGEAYNVPGEYYSNLEVLEKIATHLGKEKTDYKKHITDRPAPDRRYSMDGAKLEGLGWKRKHVFDESLKEVIKWYDEHQDWTGKIKRSKEFDDHFSKQLQGKHF